MSDVMYHHTAPPLVTASLMVQTVKKLPSMWETWAQSLGWEDPLEKGTANHSIFSLIFLNLFFY